MSILRTFQRGVTESHVSMKQRQAPLIEQYKLNGKDAVVLDSAQTNSDWSDINNPLATAVQIDKSETLTKVGVHHAVGGESDHSTPGDILCASLAACLDSTIRVIANRFDLSLGCLNVKVIGEVDVRGTLRVDHSVPVAFTKFDVEVEIKSKRFIPNKYLDRLLAAAEQSCIVMQTLKSCCEVNLTRK